MAACRASRLVAASAAHPAVEAMGVPDAVTPTDTYSATLGTPGRRQTGSRCLGGPRSCWGGDWQLAFPLAGLQPSTTWRWSIWLPWVDPAKQPHDQLCPLWHLGCNDHASMLFGLAGRLGCMQSPEAPRLCRQTHGAKAADLGQNPTAAATTLQAPAVRCRGSPRAAAGKHAIQDLLCMRQGYLSDAGRRHGPRWTRCCTGRRSSGCSRLRRGLQRLQGVASRSAGSLACRAAPGTRR